MISELVMFPVRMDGEDQLAPCSVPRGGERAETEPRHHPEGGKVVVRGPRGSELLFSCMCAPLEAVHILIHHEKPLGPVSEQGTVLVPGFLVMI